MIEFDLTPFINSLKRLESFVNSHRPLEIAAKIAKANIRGRSARGKSYTGQSFKAYKPEYKKSKSKKGYDTSTVNLRATGRYLDNLYDKGDSRERILSPAQSQMGQAQGLSRLRKHMVVNQTDAQETERVLAKRAEFEMSKG